MTGAMTVDDDCKSPQVVIVETDKKTRDEVAGSEKWSKTKRRLIVAVSGVVVTVLVLVAILVGVKFFLDSTNDVVKKTLEFSTSDGRQLSQDQTSYSAENVIEYHRVDDNYQVWVIEDYNRDIKVMKTVIGAGTFCFVSVLNGSEYNAQATSNASVPTGPVPTVNTNHVTSQRPIKDKSVLGHRGAQLCGGHDVYWITPQCGEDPSPVKGNFTSRLSKRSAWCSVYSSGHFYTYGQPRPGQTGQPGGLQGQTGQQGATGATGNAGLAGNAGSTGNADATGSSGSTGNAAATGNAGSTGYAGLTGWVDTEDSSGSMGATGVAGSTGSVGSSSVCHWHRCFKAYVCYLPYYSSHYHYYHCMWFTICCCFSF